MQLFRTKASQHGMASEQKLAASRFQTNVLKATRLPKVNIRALVVTRVFGTPANVLVTRNIRVYAVSFQRGWVGCIICFPSHKCLEFYKKYDEMYTTDNFPITDA